MTSRVGYEHHYFCGVLRGTEEVECDRHRLTIRLPPFERTLGSFGKTGRRCERRSQHVTDTGAESSDVVETTRATVALIDMPSDPVAEGCPSV
jgi:hypothetical protein